MFSNDWYNTSDLGAYTAASGGTHSAAYSTRRSLRTLSPTQPLPFDSRADMSNINDWTGSFANTNIFGAAQPQSSHQQSWYNNNHNNGNSVTPSSVWSSPSPSASSSSNAGSLSRHAAHHHHHASTPMVSPSLPSPTTTSSSSLSDYLTSLPRTTSNNGDAWLSSWPHASSTSSSSSSSWWAGASTAAAAPLTTPAPTTVASQPLSSLSSLSYNPSTRGDKRRRDFDLAFVDVVTRTKRLCLGDDEHNHDATKRTRVRVTDATAEDVEAEQKESKEEVVDDDFSSTNGHASGAHNSKNKTSTALILYKAPSVDPLMYVHTATSMDELLSSGTSSSSRRLKSLLAMNTLPKSSGGTPRSILVGQHNHNNRRHQYNMTHNNNSGSNNGTMNTDEDGNEIDDRDPAPEDDDIEVDISQLAATQHRRSHNAYDSDDDGIRVHATHDDDNDEITDDVDDIGGVIDTDINDMPLACCAGRDCAPTNALVIYDPSGMTRMFNDLGDNRRFSCHLPGAHHHHPVSKSISSASSSSQSSSRDAWYNGNSNGIDGSAYLRSIQRNDDHTPSSLSSLPIIHTRSQPITPSFTSSLPDPPSLHSPWSSQSSSSILSSSGSPLRSKRSYNGATLDRGHDDAYNRAWNQPSSQFTTATLPPITSSSFPSNTSQPSWLPSSSPPPLSSPFDTRHMDGNAWSPSSPSSWPNMSMASSSASLSAMSSSFAAHPQAQAASQSVFQSPASSTSSGNGMRALPTLTSLSSPSPLSRATPVSAFM